MISCKRPFVISTLNDSAFRSANRFHTNILFPCSLIPQFHNTMANEIMHRYQPLVVVKCFYDFSLVVSSIRIDEQMREEGGGGHKRGEKGHRILLLL